MVLLLWLCHLLVTLLTAPIVFKDSQNHNFRTFQNDSFINKVEN